MRYLFLLEGEDRTEFSYEVEADTLGEAEAVIDEVYPEATILGYSEQGR